MVPAKEFIVAIEFGSSKMTGIAGKRNLDGSISVLAVAKEDSSTFIRKGVVYNIDKTAQCLKSIVKKLETQLKTQITKVYLGVGGQSVRSVKNVISKDLPAGSIVTDSMIDTLVDANRNMSYPDLEILDIAVQEYRVDQQLQIDPVGIQCTHLEGNYLNILQRKAFYTSFNKCFELAGIRIAEVLNAPLALADAVLTEPERRSGCVLVDIGADTTTVSVYSKNILRHLAVIPLGGNNITKDIASLQMEESDAEKMKLKYASAYTDNNDIDNTLQFSIDPDRQVESRRFIEIVEGRMMEIVENVRCQIPDEYYNKLLGGIILTGGGANMPNIEYAFKHYTRVDKVRVAKFVEKSVTGGNDGIKSHNGMMNTVLGLLIKGNQNCAGNAIDPNDIFGQQSVQAADDDDRPVRRPGEIPAGVVLTAAEKEKAEEDRKKEEDRQREEEEERLREEERKRRENNLWNKFKKRAKDFGKTIISPEDE